jgi:DNA polymerase III epsilon subunit-like protein
MTDLISVDIETTGLDPARHEAWEIALIKVDEHEGDDPDFTPFECSLHMPVTLVGAEVRALEVGQYLERYTQPNPGQTTDTTSGRTVGIEDAVTLLFQALKGNRLMGMSVHFDASFLSELFRRYGWEPTPWHHRHLDLGSFAGGLWGYGQPLSSARLAEQHVPNPNPHTALGDARWNVSVWHEICKGQLAMEDR